MSPSQGLFGFLQNFPLRIAKPLQSANALHIQVLLGKESVMEAGEGWEKKHVTNMGTVLQMLCEIQKVQEAGDCRRPQPRFEPLGFAFLCPVVFLTMNGCLQGSPEAYFK